MLKLFNWIFDRGYNEALYDVKLAVEQRGSTLIYEILEDLRLH